MFYVELLKNANINGRIYYAGIYQFKHVPHPYEANANRIWYETEKGTVWYAQKHRRLDKVDPKEFFWVKLKARKEHGIF